jgi:type VI secretion system protein ImpL
MSTPRKTLPTNWLIGLVAALLVAALIWFGGPYLAIGDVRPFESLTGRLLGIMALVIAWGGFAQFKLLAAERKGARLAGDVAAQIDPGTAEPDARPGLAPSPTGDAEALSERFSRAVASLRKSGLSASLYDLPWYVIIGAPGSGKTTALLNAGLEFPLEAEFGKDPLKGIGGTRNCDWWITRDAILLDTAGRFTTQDSSTTADRAGWQAFLELLKQYRRRRPINGVLLAISLADLMDGDDTARIAHAHLVKRRLSELRASLQIPFPVYVLLTKADLISGFTEYFDDLNADGRAQVWGFTFPLSDSQDGNPIDQMPQELGALVARLQERVVERLAAERDAARRAAVHAFPAQIGGLARQLTDFLARIFEDVPADEAVWLRGCYFTSGTQTGAPVDRMMGALARSFGLRMQSLGLRAERGRAYFLETLLKEVVFKESGLAGVNRRVERLWLAGSAATHAGLLILTLLTLVGLTFSYTNNRAYLDGMSETTARLLANDRRPGDSALEAALTRLDILHLVSGMARDPGQAKPWSMRWGLYQPGGMGDAAEDAYRRELNTILGPWVAQRLAVRLRELGAEPDALYEYLKAYLMLNGPKRLEPQLMKAIGDREWPRAFPRDAELAQRLTLHFDAWVDRPDRLVPVAADHDLVTQARASLRQASVPRLIYSRLRSAHAGNAAGQIRIDNELGLGVESLLMRRSGLPLTTPLSALYTRAAFEQIGQTHRLELIRQFLEDAWVLGDAAPGMAEIPNLSARVLDLYETDYIQAWDALLNDLSLRPFGDTIDAMTAIARLAGPSSPLKGLLTLVDRHTNLSPTEGSAPGGRITRHFQKLHQLVSGPPGAAPIDRTLAELHQLQQQMQMLPPGAGAGHGLTQLTGQMKVIAAQLPGPIANMVSEAGSQSSALAGAAVRSGLEQRYLTEVARECRELIGRRYPFDRSSQGEVATADFARVFAPGGTFDAFFQGHLAPLVDTSRTPWRWRDAASRAPAIPLATFENAERIRQAFFPPGSAVPVLHFTLTPESLDTEANRFVLTLDNQVLEYRHGPRQPSGFTWPAPVPAGASFVFEGSDGQRPNRSYAGAWALFRMLQDARVSSEFDTRYVLTLSSGGRSARVVLTASSIRNPFGNPDLLRFQCEG